MKEGSAVLERKPHKIEILEEKFRAWMIGQGHFRFEDPTAEETIVSGQDILEHYNKIEPIVPVNDRWFVKALVDYVKAPRIHHDFLSNAARHDWQTKELYEHPEFLELYERNKLKGNVIGSVLGIAEYAIAERLLDPLLDYELIKKGAELLIEYKGSDEFNRYITMTSEEKIAITKKVADFTKELYLVIAKRLTPDLAIAKRFAA